MSERDHRIEILTSLLNTPHGKLELLWQRHQGWLGEDPHFYLHLAAWYFEHGEVRDHKELFVSALCLAQDTEHREIGGRLLVKLAPHEVSHCISIVKEVADRNVPRSMKRRITEYLREREADPARLTRAVMFARTELKRLYASLHVRPNTLAQSLLFEEPPADSALGRLKKLARLSLAEEQLPVLLEMCALDRPPFLVVNPLLDRAIWGMTEAAVALIELMSPYQVVNHLRMLAERGLFAKDETADAIREKIRAVVHQKRFSTMKAQRAIKALEEAGETELMEEWKLLLDEVTQERLEQKADITRNIAMFVDKSSSMDRAIELAKEIGAAIAPLCKGELTVVAFDSIPVPVAAPMSGDLTVWKEALKNIRASGATSIGAPLSWIRKRKILIEQAILISDGEENTRPFFWKEVQAYEKAHGALDVIWVRVGGTSRQADRWGKEGLPLIEGEFTVLDARGSDYFALPNLISLLGGPSWFDKVIDIASYPLPSDAPPPPA